MDAQAINRRFKAVDNKEPLTHIAGWLRGESKQVPVIMHGKKPYAIVDSRRLGSRGIRAGTKTARAALPVPVIQEDASPEEVLKHFSETQAPYLPVVDAHHRLVGTVSAESALEWLDEAPDAAHACEKVAALSPEDDIEAATQAFARTRADHLPVVLNGRLVGELPRSAILRLQAITDQPDGLRDWGGESSDIRHQPIASHMNAAWSECKSRDPFDLTRDTVSLNGYAFVVKGGHVEGILTAPSIERAALRKR